LALDHAAKLGLGMPQLVMEAAQGTLGRAGVIVLDEEVLDAQASKFRLLLGFQEKTPSIVPHLGTNLPDTGQRCFYF